jgi:hypothetical protein
MSLPRVIGYGAVVVVFGSVSVGVVAVGEVLVGDVEVFVLSSTDTLPRFSPHAATPAEAPAPRAAARAMIPARLSMALG